MNETTRPLYVFDLDETLIDGDSSTLWAEYLVAQGWVDGNNFLLTEREMMKQYSLGEMDMPDYLDFTLAPLKTRSKELVDALVEQFVTEVIDQRIYPQARDLLNALHNEDTQVLIISATVAFLVKAIAKKIGVKEAIGIDLIMQDNCYSSQISGTPSYKEGKIQRLNMWLDGRSEQHHSIHFYTDSINDLSLCLHADIVNLVNPCQKLKNYLHTQECDWKILYWNR